MHYTPDQWIVLIVVALLYGASVSSYFLNSKKLAKALLLIGSGVLGLFMASLDPFLNVWDEQYHALVAKNLASDPLKPLLFNDPLLGYSFQDWTNNYIWLHKQPLFLWQIALSLKIFGNTALAVRLPSVLMHVGIAFFTLRIGQISADERVGYLGALCYSVAFFPLEMLAGVYATDHNDIAFLFYVTASIWCWFEYSQNKNLRWALLAGLFSGCAILVKWLVGLLVYALWGASLIPSLKDRKSLLAEVKMMGLSLMGTAIVALPWQLYISSVFPEESAYEYALNTEHFFEAIESHSGGIWFHFEALSDIYGAGLLVPFLVLIGFGIYLYSAPKKKHRYALLSGVLIIYLFYSLAATKMTAFTMVVSPLLFLGIGALIDFILRQLSKRISSKLLVKTFSTLSVILVVYLFMNPVKVYHNHTNWKPHDNRNRRIELLQFDLQEALKEAYSKDEEIRVFNADVRLNGHVSATFFTPWTCYQTIPNQQDINRLRAEGFKTVVVMQNDNDYNPDLRNLDWFEFKVTP